MQVNVPSAESAVEAPVEQCEAAVAPIAPPPLKGKGKGAPPAPPALKGKGKGKGKAPALPPPTPPGKPPTPPFAARKVQQLVRSLEINTDKDQALFGRKLHWVKPGYQDLAGETVFQELEEKEKMNVDGALLTAMFTPRSRAQSDSGTPKRLGTPRRSTGMALLDSKRAQNMAIVFAQLKSSSDAICEQLRAMDFSEPLLTADQVELILGAFPTLEESQLIIASANKKEELRDVERKVLPFCEVPHCELRLRLLRASMSHESRFETIVCQLWEVQLASNQIRLSKLLRKLFFAVLDVGNRVNGVTDSSRAVRSFAIETLPAICTFKVDETSMRHFLCLTLHKSDCNFLQDLVDDVPCLANAARTKLHVLKEEVDAFCSDASSVQRDVKDVWGDNAQAELNDLCLNLRKEAAQLQDHMTRTHEAQTAAQVYFGATGKLPPSDVFFGYLKDFLENLCAAWYEIGQNPAKWRRFSDEHLDGIDNDKASEPLSPKICNSPISPKTCNSPISPKTGNSQDSGIPKLQLSKLNKQLFDSGESSAECASGKDDDCASTECASDDEPSEPSSSFDSFVSISECTSNCIFEFHPSAQKSTNDDGCATPKNLTPESSDVDVTPYPSSPASSFTSIHAGTDFGCNDQEKDTQKPTDKATELHVPKLHLTDSVLKRAEDAESKFKAKSLSISQAAKNLAKRVANDCEYAGPKKTMYKPDAAEPSNTLPSVSLWGGYKMYALPLKC